MRLSPSEVSTERIKEDFSPDGIGPRILVEAGSLPSSLDERRALLNLVISELSIVR
jgi:hypothetical protein